MIRSFKRKMKLETPSSESSEPPQSAANFMMGARNNLRAEVNEKKNG